MTTIIKMTTMLLSTVFLIATLIDNSSAGIAASWSQCHCSWASWGPWSSCNSTCWGSRRRSRAVWTTCPKFSDCASHDLAWDHENCNSFCYNGGVANSNKVCTCAGGWRGTCCNQEVTCGTPRRPVNGYIQGNSYKYGDVIYYTCRRDYNITGDVMSTCGADGVWSGSTPRCVYVNTCSSSPCQNEAECVNGLNQYTCVCKPGYSGRHCENDIQPPLVSNCSESFTVNATSHKVRVTWNVPNFYDPFGHEVKSLSSNYDDNEAVFQWGDFTVQYVAVKPLNGLRTECVFNISVRPTPCPPLAAPFHGAVVCNDWQSDYALVCQVFCKGDYSLSNGEDHRQQYVCGADGNWIPALPLPECHANQPRVSTNSVHDMYNIDDYNYASCSTDYNKMADTYINHLSKSGFSDLCLSYPQQCRKENVHVMCGSS